MEREVEKFISLLEKKNILITRAFGLVKKRISSYNFKKYYDDVEKNKDEITNWEVNQLCSIDIRHNYSTDLKIIKEWILNGDKKVKAKILELKKLIKINNKQIGINLINENRKIVEEIHSLHSFLQEMKSLESADFEISKIIEINE